MSVFAKHILSYVSISFVLFSLSFRFGFFICTYVYCDSFIGLFLPHTAFFPLFCSTVAERTAFFVAAIAGEAVCECFAAAIQLYVYISVWWPFWRYLAPTNGLCVRTASVFDCLPASSFRFSIVLRLRWYFFLFGFSNNHSHSVNRVVVTVTPHILIIHTRCTIVVYLSQYIALITSPLSSTEFHIDALLFNAVLNLTTGTSYIAPADLPLLISVASFALVLSISPFLSLFHLAVSAYHVVWRRYGYAYICHASNA